MGERPRHELYAGLSLLYQSRDYSDLVLFSEEGSRHNAHKAIICPRGKYFETTVKEGRWKDGIEGHIALPDDDEVVRLLVEYFYLLDYLPVSETSERDRARCESQDSDSMSVGSDPRMYGVVYGASAISAFGGPLDQQSQYSPSFRPRNDSTLTVHALPSTSENYASFSNNQPRRRKTTGNMVLNAPEPSPLATKDPHLVLHARMYAAAHRYSIGGLEALSLDKFKIQLTRHWDSAELAEAIHVVYTATPSQCRDMREAVADILGWHVRLLEKPEIEVAILEIDKLAYDLLKRSRRAAPEYLE